jgi:penicillin amidase
MRRLVSLGLILTAAFATGRAQSPATSLQLSGVSQPVEIIRDRWGINHIYAQNEPDLFFAQGYAAAKDRLFQFEMWRRQATGTVAEILGRRELTRDRGARLHQFRGDLDDELNRYHPRGKAIVEAYVRGVNAYVAETERNPALLPIEFRMLGITPGRWTPAVVISRHQALNANLTDEVRLVRAINAGGVAAVRDLMNFQGGDPRFELDAAINPSIFPTDLLAVYTAFRESIRFRPEDIAPEFRGSTTRALRLASSPLQGRHLIPQDPWTSMPIRATSAPTTGSCPDRARSARGRSSPTIRIE